MVAGPQRQSSARRVCVQIGGETKGTNEEEETQRTDHSNNTHAQDQTGVNKELPTQRMHTHSCTPLHVRTQLLANVVWLLEHPVFVDDCAPGDAAVRTHGYDLFRLRPHAAVAAMLGLDAMAHAQPLSAASPGEVAGGPAAAATAACHACASGTLLCHSLSL